ncbi:MAG: 2-isopropylmalate synthase [uncultured Thermomicrobiales bacterium]|uniref:2-isopropylmalate synthase n=1 Tax=uncultured Thermomicrobiales bacterium TaxID=1645740 RepID=A0A6J4UTE9_9BACT|nr:MAG: 2-isopropylmalate synthase [uncultured Thermomicrobiales bacterium]
MADVPADANVAGLAAGNLPADRVIVFDTTLRDGEQSPGATLTADEKLEVADALVALGVDVIEAGFPAASPGDFEAVRSIAARARGVVVAGLARAVESDIERAAQAVKGAESPRIHTFIATSDIHLTHKLRTTREALLDRVTAMVGFARSFTDDVEFSAEDATRSDWDFLVTVFKRAVEAGATTLNVPDTVGYTTPDEMAALIRYLRERVAGIDRCVISVHCHDDLGMATANTLAAVAAGARQVEVTVNGIGERAGNTALEEVVMALGTRRDFFGGATTGVRTERIVPTSRLVSGLTGLQVQANKAIVGANAFAHEAGIHQDGVLKERTTYEIMDPSVVGWEGTKLVLGKHSGRAGFRSTLADIGIRLDQAQLDQAYSRFLVLADRKQRVTAADLVALVGDQLATGQDTLRLVRWNASLGSAGPATASVVVARGDAEHGGDGVGNGPVDALFQAIEAATGIENELEHYHVEAVTPGEDAQGQVRIRVRAGDAVATGHGLATDIVEASARAYLAALSRLEVDPAYRRPEAVAAEPAG